MRITWTNVDLSSVRSSDIHEGCLAKDTSAISNQNLLENCVIKIPFKSPRGQWVKGPQETGWGPLSISNIHEEVTFIRLYVKCFMILVYRFLRECVHNLYKYMFNVGILDEHP